MLKIADLAKREGVTYSIVYQWVKGQGLPFLQLGGRMYVDETDFDNWKASKRTVIDRAEVIFEEFKEPTNPVKMTPLKAKLLADRNKYGFGMGIAK